MTEISWEIPDERLLPDQAVVRVVAAALAHGGRPGLALAVVFVQDEALTELHRRHLADPTPTDVLTFDLGEDGPGPAGELYVSVDRARRVAARRSMSVERELSLYVVHGVLHLCGYDDREPAERERMRAAEGEVLAALGFPPDPAPHDLGVD